MRGPWDTPSEECPYCGTLCDAEFVDVGVGMEQVTPYMCEGCHAVQIGPYDEPRPLNDREVETGWYQGDVK